MRSPAIEASADWMPLPHAARQLKVTWHRAYAEMLAGRLTSKWDGRKWLVTRRSVSALQRAHGIATAKTSDNQAA